MVVWLVSLILIITVVLLITEKIPMDLTAVGILAALTITGILTPKEALAGFGNASVITIAAMFILSRSLMRTGAVGLVSEKIILFSKGKERRILLMGMVITAIASAFINNTPVVVLLTTIVMSVCCEYGLSPSTYLIPISYSSIVGGICTLIGTSTNLIVSDLSSWYGYGGLHMFELIPVGLPAVLVTLVLLYFVAPHVMPRHKAPICEMQDKDAPHYLAEFVVPPDSPMIGSEPLSFLSEHYPEIELFEVVRLPIIYFPERERVQTAEGDLLLVKGTANALLTILMDKVIVLPQRGEENDIKVHDEKTLIMELMIPPQSDMVGEDLIQFNLYRELGVQVIAVKRRRTHYSEQKIRGLRLSVGDILLIHCPRDRLDEIRTKSDFIVLESIHHQIINKRKAPVALLIFAGMIISATLGLADLTVCAITAVFLSVATGCIQLRDAYRAVDVRILMMIVGTIALGVAMEKTGAAKIYADALLSPLKGQQPTVILAAFLLLSIVLTELMSNSATAVLLLPIGISTALALGISPKPFIIALCIGASCGFAIPIGYQTHLIVYGPGGYRFADFLKLGIPLDLIVWAMGSMLIPVFWPF